MNRISFPIEPGNQGSSVADLQAGLRFLIDKGFFEFNRQERAEILQTLDDEIANSLYGDITAQLVSLFHRPNRPEANGIVDEQTAIALNEELSKRGAFDQAAQEQQRLVAGQVYNPAGLPLLGIRVRAFHSHNRSKLRLGEDTTDAEGRYTISYSPPAGIIVNLGVFATGDNGQTLQASAIITSAGPVEIVDLVVQASDSMTFQVEGQVTSRSSPSVGGLAVRIVDKGVGGDRLLAESVTGDNGAYQVTFTGNELQERGKKKADLQARVFRNEILLGASEVRYDAGQCETLNVLISEQETSGLESEHETLIAALRSQFSGRLADLKETEKQQDITFLANKIGWDARAVAMAALSEQFSLQAIEAKAEIEPAFFYALFRSGLPANQKTLYTMNSIEVEKIWKEAIAQGVVPSALEARLPESVEAFQKLVALQALDNPPSVGLASLKEMLAVSLGVDPNPEVQRQKEIRFADLYTRHRDDMDAFWQDVRQSFGEPMEQRLRLDGQLALLTLNNASLISKLHVANGGERLTKSVDLVEAGYYQPEKWLQDLTDLPIPQEIPGADEDERRTRYAELMAAQIQLSFPTATVAQMVFKREMELASPELAVPVSNFLNKQEGFELGVQPIEQFLVQKGVKIEEETRPIVQEVKRLQRVVAITPDNRSMRALLEKGLGSAQAVTRYDRKAFIRDFKDEVGGETVARLIYDRAEQVHNAVLNLAMSFAVQNNAPGIGVHSPAQILNPSSSGSQAIGADVIAYPTLENLFGGTDFCACEHCRSMLSPAAYLVDLLHFLDRDDAVWDSFLTNWKTDHKGVPYPFTSTTHWENAGSPQETKLTPLQVLLSRRPDIQHLPLTCENTNTPLPYIDLVNESLEHFVTTGSLAEYTGHTTDGSASVEELLANPQFVAAEAFTILAGAHFPPPLPFHQPLENLRRYFDHFESPLTEVMESLRKDDSLERQTDSEYGWRDILMEELRLSRAEYHLLTDRTVTLQELYGYPPDKPLAEVIADLSNTKTFSRRIGISYEELIEILKTRFVNPGSTLIPRLERLGVTFDTLKKFKEGKITDEQFEAALAPQLDASQYGGDIKAWVKDDANFANIMGLITLANPVATLIRKLVELGVTLETLKALKEGAITDAEFEAGLPDGLDVSDFGGDVAKWVRDNFTVAAFSNNSSFDQLEFRYSDPTQVTQPMRAIEFIRLLRFVRLWKKLGWGISYTDKAIAALYPAHQIPGGREDEAASLMNLDTGFLALLPRLGVLRRTMKELKLRAPHDLLPLLALFAPLDSHDENSLYRRMFLSPALVKQDPAFAEDGFGNYLQDAKEKVNAHSETLRAAFALTAEELELITAALDFNVETPLTMENIGSIFRRGWLARTLRLSVREFLLLTRFIGLDPFAVPDPPNPPVLGLIDLLQRLRRVSMKPAQALYLIWNEDVSGKSVPEEKEILDLARVLRAGLAAIESEFNLTTDPDGQIARARMSLVYGNEATDQFFGLLNRTFITDVKYDHKNSTLEQTIVDAALGLISYDDFRKRLTFNGVMPEATRAALRGVDGVEQAFQEAVNDLFEETRSFFVRFPELLQLHDAFIASDKPEEKKRSELLEGFLPELKRRRKRQQVLQVISATARTELEFARAVLDAKLTFSAPLIDPSIEPVYILHAAGDPSRPGLDDLVAAEMPGFSAWNGYLEAPEDDFYNFLIETEPGVNLVLTLNGNSVALVQDGNVYSNREPIELHAGTLYPITLKGENLQVELSIRWETRGRGRESIPARFLYPATGINALGQAYVRFLKAVSLAKILNLEADELAYLAAHPLYRINGQSWLNQLPVIGQPVSEVSDRLLQSLEALLNFASIKFAFRSEDTRLLSMLQDPAAAAQGSESLLFSLTRWEPNSLKTLLAHFGKTPNDLADLAIFRRVYEAMAWVRKMGVPAAGLILAATNEPHAGTVSALQSALRARFKESDWLQILKPINDEMRALQRDALVAHILQEMQLDSATAHIDTSEKLFEFFLMDVQMEPCMQTSRIRHALSSVQLFIERSLMNLETHVSPAAISAEQWEWMSRYRVWEANRKVFLFPENWLEPELRDDQSPFFKETISELMQSDITEDSAQVALLNYLEKLEAVAKLEPCGIFYEEDDTSTEVRDDVIHIVARTSGANCKYYYRCRRYGSWTPWEQIRLDIEGNPVIPVVWRGRLLLFWLRILKDSPISNPPQPPTGHLAEVDARKLFKTSTPKVRVRAILCWSEYYNGKWQPARTSDINRPVKIGDAFSLNEFSRSALRLEVFEHKVGAGAPLVVGILGQGVGVKRFILYNTHGVPEQNLAFSPPNDPIRTVNTDDALLTLTYDQVRFPDELNLTESLVRSVMKNRTGDRMSARAPLHDNLNRPWVSPFLLHNSRDVFFVSTAEHIRALPDWGGYLPIDQVAGGSLKLPPLLQPELPALDGDGSEAEFVDVDLADMKLFVTEDAYIRRVISTGHTVRFGEIEIGPAGSLLNGNHQG
jgi:hypothetical protein